MKVEEELQEWAKKAAACFDCGLGRQCRQKVFSDGPASAKIMLIGEAPGKQEDLKGLPFVGRAGEKINALLKKAGTRREDVYFCNVLKCRPPQNRTPRVDEVAACQKFIEAQIRLVNPKVLVLLGKSAIELMIGKTVSVGKIRGKIIATKFKVKAVTTYHPAFLLHKRDERNEEKVVEDLKLAVSLAKG